MDKNTQGVMFSKKSDEWSTEQGFFNKLDAIFNFTLNPCSTHLNCKTKKHYTIEDNGLNQDWSGESVFVNNPYSKTKDWAKKCAKEGENPDTIVVQLIPSRTDTKYSQNDVFPNAQAILFIKGRLKFNGMKTSAPFPSMVAIYSQHGLTGREVDELRKLGSLMFPFEAIVKGANNA